MRMENLVLWLAFISPIGMAFGCRTASDNSGSNILSKGHHDNNSGHNDSSGGSVLSGQAYAFKCSCPNNLSKSDCAPKGGKPQKFTLSLNGDLAIVNYSDFDVTYSGTYGSEDGNGHSIYHGFKPGDGMSGPPLGIGDKESNYDVYLDTGLLSGGQGYFVAKNSSDGSIVEKVYCNRN